MSDADRAHRQNPGQPFDAAWLAAPVSESAPGYDAPPTAPGAGDVAPEGLRALIAGLDLTTLSGEDDVTRVETLCATARAPLGAEDPLRCAAVCVFPAFVPTAREALDGSGVAVATVAAGFPHGLSDPVVRRSEVAAAAAAGADEIDIVIARHKALHGDWQALYDEVAAFKAAAGAAHLKVILSTGELGGAATVARASLTAALAGADFVKTSTGKESVNATAEAAQAILAALAAYRSRSGHTVGFKPAGGVGTPEAAAAYRAQARALLGATATGPSHFRIGASSLLDKLIERLR